MLYSTRNHEVDLAYCKVLYNSMSGAIFSSGLPTLKVLDTEVNYILLLFPYL